MVVESLAQAPQNKAHLGISARQTIQSAPARGHQLSPVKVYCPFTQVAEEIRTAAISESVGAGQGAELP